MKAATASPESKKLARASNAFGLDLYGKLKAETGNLVISPSSLTTALLMPYLGAKGDTASAMQKTLHLEGDAAEVQKGVGNLIGELSDGSRQVTLEMANRLYGDKAYPFEQPFLDTTNRVFGAPLELVDFRTAFEPARATINGWVEERTHQRIKDLIPQNGLDNKTRLVLVNATYFQGDWQHPFDKSQTAPAPFIVKAKSTVDVPMMHASGTFRVLEKDGMKMLELPYRAGAMKMLLVLPDAVDGLAKLESGLTAERFEGWSAALSEGEVDISLPKLDLAPANSLSLKEPLEALGMKIAFSNKADFTGIAKPPEPDQQLKITHVFHKAFVKLDEKGTEAAAATAVVMGEKGTGAAPKRIEFKADHPFLFFIVDEASGLVLFLGRVSNPGTGK
ncbi:MAG: serpin family protein [Polyangiaceae bacterium]